MRIRETNGLVLTPNNVKRIPLILMLAMVVLTGLAQKKVHIPSDFTSQGSTYSADRSFQTANLIFFWEEGVGVDTNEMEACEAIYDNYLQRLDFASRNPEANIHQYKFAIMIRQGNNGVAYGGGVDNITGAMWIEAAMVNRFMFAYELGHAFSYMARIDGIPGYGFGERPHNNGSRIYVGPFWPMTAGFMACQNAGFVQDATKDLALYVRTNHYYFTNARNRNQGWPMLEALKSELGLTYLGRVWLEAEDPEHPTETIRRLFTGNDQEQLNDLFGRCAMRIAQWDFEAPLGPVIRDYIRTSPSPYIPTDFQTILNPLSVEKGRFAIPDYLAPQEHGFNVIKLFPVRDAAGNSLVSLRFRGLACNDNAGWRYGFVALGEDHSPRYSPLYAAPDTLVEFEVLPGDREVALVVMGAPRRHANYRWEAGFPKVYRYPYEIALKNALPEGYQDEGAPRVEGALHSNGGGFVARTAQVDATAYVGPEARVLGTARVLDHARVEGRAVVADRAEIRDRVVVKGHARVGESAKISGNVVIADAAKVFGSEGSISGNVQILGNAVVVGGAINGDAIIKDNAFQWGQTIGGSAVMGGDNENTSASSGVYLQKPDPTNNLRAAGDGKGADDPSNIDINNSECAYAADEYMAVGLETGKKTKQMLLFPNPCADMLTITGIDRIALVEILDLRGELVCVYAAPGTGGMDLTGLSEGMYFVRVHAADGVRTERVTVSRNTGRKPE